MIAVHSWRLLDDCCSFLTSSAPGCIGLTGSNPPPPLPPRWTHLKQRSDPG